MKVILDGVPKGFEKYRQGSIFIEPELIKQIEVNKGAHTSLYGNGGFGGVITVETKDAQDLLEGGENVGAMLKYSRHSNNGGKRRHRGSLRPHARRPLRRHGLHHAAQVR